MPRMLSLWLDYSEKPIEERRKVELAQKRNNNPFSYDSIFNIGNNDQRSTAIERAFGRDQQGDIEKVNIKI